MRYLNPQRYLFLWVAALMLLLQACAVTPVDVYKEADSESQKVLATIEIAKIYTEAAVGVAANPATAPEVKHALQTVNGHLRKVIDTLFAVYIDYQNAKAAWEAGEPGAKGKLMVVSSNLKSWIVAAEVHINALKGLVTGGK